MTATDHLRDLLTTLRTQRRRRLLVEAAASVVIAVVAAILVGGLVTSVLGRTGSGVLVARLAGYGLVAAAAVRFLVLPLLHRGSDSEFALYVEERAPGLKQGLLSAVHELRQPAARQASPVLTARVVEHAVYDLRSLARERRIERPREQRAQRLLAGAAAAALLLLAFGPARLRDTARVLFAPWSVAIAATPPAPAVGVKPGDASVPRGGALDIRATLAHFSADGAELVLRADSAPEWIRLPMGRESADGAFAARLFDLTQPTEYFVEANGVRSRTYRLRITDLPAVTQLAVALRFPPYTGLAMERIEDGGDIAAVAGTMVTIEPQVTRPVRSGSLVFDDGRTVPLETDSSGQLRGRFRLTRGGFYRVDLVAPDGRSVAGGVQYAVEVLKDRAPSVRISTPGRDTKVTALEEVTIEATASDDFGVRSLELRYRVNGGAERTIVLAAPTGQAQEAQAAHTLLLEEMSLKPGDLVAYNAAAKDAKGQEALSDVYFLEVRPWSRNYRQAESGGGGGTGGGGGGGSPSAFVQRQRDVVAGTYNWLRDSAAHVERQRNEDVTTLAIAQGSLREEVKTLAQRLLERGVTRSDTLFSRIRDALVSASKEMETAESNLGKRDGRAALPFEERALRDLQRADALYRDVQVQREQPGGGGGGGGGAREAQDLADLFELENDRMRNQYEAVQQQATAGSAREVDETLERLRQLAARQQQENERLQRQAEAMRDRMGREAGGGGGGAQRELARQAEEEARRLERLAREQENPDLAAAAQQMQRAADAMRQAAGGSESQGSAALEQLQRAAQRLQDARNNSLSEGIRNLAGTARQLEEKQGDIAADVQRMQGASGAQRAEQQRQLSARKDALGAAVGRLEAEADRLSREGRRDQPNAASRLREASEAIREQRVQDKIQFSKSVIRGGSPEYANAFEEQIGDNIGQAAEKLREAVGALAGESVARQQERALAQARELVRGVERLRERAQQQAAEGQQDRQGQPGQPGQQAQPGQGGGGNNPRDAQARDGRATDGSMRGGRAPSLNSGQVRQLANEFGLRRADAEALRDLARAQGLDVAALNRAIEDLRRLESGRPLADYRASAVLQATLVERLKAFEFALFRQLTQDAGPRSTLGARSPVPTEFRAEVEEYYRSLARPQTSPPNPRP